MKMDIYVDTFRTKHGSKNITILGDGYMVCESDVKINEIPKIVEKYNSNLIHKYGNNVELHYYVDIRGIGMGVYDFLKESDECKDLKIHKLELAKVNFNRENNNGVEIKFDKLINIDGDIVHYHDSTGLSGEVVGKITEIAKGVVNDFSTKMKNDLDKLDVYNY